MYIQDNEKKAKTKGEKKANTGEKLEKGPKPAVGNHWRIKSQCKEKVVDDVDKMKAAQKYLEKTTIGRSSLLLFSLSDQFIFTT